MLSIVAIETTANIVKKQGKTARRSSYSGFDILLSLLTVKVHSTGNQRVPNKPAYKSFRKPQKSQQVNEILLAKPGGLFYQKLQPFIVVADYIHSSPWQDNPRASCNLTSFYLLYPIARLAGNAFLLHLQILHNRFPLLIICKVPQAIIILFYQNDRHMVAYFISQSGKYGFHIAQYKAKRIFVNRKALYPVHKIQVTF